MLGFYVGFMECMAYDSYSRLADGNSLSEGSYKTLSMTPHSVIGFTCLGY